MSQTQGGEQPQKCSTQIPSKQSGSRRERKLANKEVHTNNSTCELSS